MGVTGDRPNRSDVSIDRFGRRDAGGQPIVAAIHLPLNLGSTSETVGAKMLRCLKEKFTGFEGGKKKESRDFTTLRFPQVVGASKLVKQLAGR